MKITWNLVVERNSLWTRVVRGKYRYGEDIIPKVENNQTASNLWKSICKIWPKLCETISISDGGGHDSVLWNCSSVGSFSIQLAYEFHHSKSYGD